MKNQGTEQNITKGLGSYKSEGFFFLRGRGNGTSSTPEFEGFKIYWKKASTDGIDIIRSASAEQIEWSHSYLKRDCSGSEQDKETKVSIYRTFLETSLIEQTETSF